MIIIYVYLTRTKMQGFDDSDMSKSLYSILQDVLVNKHSTYKHYFNEKQMPFYNRVFDAAYCKQWRNAEPRFVLACDDDKGFFMEYINSADRKRCIDRLKRYCRPILESQPNLYKDVNNIIFDYFVPAVSVAEFTPEEIIKLALTRKCFEHFAVLLQWFQKHSYFFRKRALYRHLNISKEDLGDYDKELYDPLLSDYSLTLNYKGMVQAVHHDTLRYIDISTLPKEVVLRMKVKDAEEHYVYYKHMKVEDQMVILKTREEAIVKELGYYLL